MSFFSQPISIATQSGEFNVTFREFNDAWQFHKTLQNFDLGVDQLSAGQFLGNIVEIKLPNVKLEKHFHNSHLRLEGCPIQSWSFGIPVRPLNLLFEHRYLLDDCYLLIAPPNASFTLVEKSLYELYIIYFDEDYFAEICDKFQIPEPHKLLLGTFNQPSAVTFPKDQQRRFGQIFSRLFSPILLSLCSQSPDSPLLPYTLLHLTEYIEEFVIAQLISVLANSRHIEPSTMTYKRLSCLRKAEMFIRDFAMAEISIADVSAASGVSKRTLEYLFKDFYGISPIAYLKCHRLNQLRQSLYAQNLSIKKINRLASEFGFWHSGQLAQDYYKLFGELPSQALS